ncbi:MAG: hypothetical protein ACPGVU_04285 [Limisphaerales bacterium]
MSAKLDQPYILILRPNFADNGPNVPPPVEYLGSNCPDYDRCVNALFFAPYSPGQISMDGLARSLNTTRKIRPDWSDSVWNASLRLKVIRR